MGEDWTFIAIGAVSLIGLTYVGSRWIASIAEQPRPEPLTYGDVMNVPEEMRRAAKGSPGEVTAKAARAQRPQDMSLTHVGSATNL